MIDEGTPKGQLLIYTDGGLKLQVRLDGQTVWLTQAQMAELYQTTTQNITLHIQGIYDDDELPEAATFKEYLQVRRAARFIPAGLHGAESTAGINPAAR